MAGKLVVNDMIFEVLTDSAQKPWVMCDPDFQDPMRQALQQSAIDGKECSIELGSGDWIYDVAICADIYIAKKDVCHCGYQTRRSTGRVRSIRARHWSLAEQDYDKKSEE